MLLLMANSVGVHLFKDECSFNKMVLVCSVLLLQTLLNLNTS